MKNKSSLTAKASAIFASLLFLMASQSLVAEPKPGKAASTQPSYLFVQSADKLQLKANPKSPNTYTIILENVNPHVTCFSERPDRKTKIISTETLVKFWQQKKAGSFLDVPPNASLVATRTGLFSKHTAVNWVVELSKPHYDAKTKTLTYSAKLLTDTAHMVPAAELESATFAHPFLFIDDVCLCCFIGTC